MITFREFLKRLERTRTVDGIVVFHPSQAEHDLLVEGKWLKVRYDREIRIDRNTHLHSGAMHAHIFDRKGNEVYALTQQGQPSHGGKRYKLRSDQATALRNRGFSIRSDGIVEAKLLPSCTLLFG